MVVCARFKWHPFLALLTAALFTGLAVGLPLKLIAKTANGRFWRLITDIGLIVILGALIGTVLEKSGATIRIADGIIHFFGKDRPVLAITVIGAVVGIPIFCDSGFVILSGLTKPLSRESKTSYTAIVGGMAGGLYITHTLLPPHPGSLGRCGQSWFGWDLGTVILTGLLISIPTTIVCWLFASRFLNKTNTQEHDDEEEDISLSSLPALWKSLLPIIIPLLLIALGSAIELVKMPEGLKNALVFFGSPVVALLCGLVFSLLLVKKGQAKIFNQWMIEAIHDMQGRSLC